MAGISLRNITKGFGPVKVIDDVSLDVGSGELVVFLGPSGSGKSTLLRMIAGLESVDGGSISIEGRASENLAPGARDVAMVFQNYALYPHMTVRQNLAFGLQNVGLDEATIESRVSDAARILEIGPLLDRKPAQLSGGQRQRVAIGRAIVKEPKAFLFDEPLSNLDAALRARTRVELAELHRRLQATMIYVTHDQTEAMTLADRIVVLNNCRIEQIGTPMEVYSTPASRFVAGFVGSPAMNFLKVRVSGGSAETADGVRFSLPQAHLADGEYDLGIRPEAISISSSDPDLHADVTVVERLGDRTLVYTRMQDGTLVTVQTGGKTDITPGQRIGLKLDRAQCHFFGPDGLAASAG